MSGAQRNLDRKIVVIGAGASGVACATKLLELGFQNVLVVEAEDRLGGRIHTIPFADNVIDLGAQWCHGERDNIVYELTRKQEEELLESTGPVYENYMCIRSNGDVVPEEVASRLKAIVGDSLVTRQLELRHCSGSLGSYLTNKFYDTLRRPENSDIDAEMAREFFVNYQKFENSVEASDTLEQVSGRGYLDYWECEGDILLNWKDKGYVELLRLLMRSRELNVEHGVLEQRLLLATRALKINWNRNDGRVELQLSNGETCIADHVVVTVSLGVLKDQHRRLFEPQLPVEKQRAIDGLAFGTVNKIFVEFPEAFWAEDWTGFTLLWRDEDLDDIRGTSRAWLEDVFGFYRVSYQPRILAGWITNESGRHMETLPADEVQAGVMYLFRRFLKWEIPEPSNFRTSAWYTNENFRGSYSYRSMDTEQLGTGARELAHPLTVVATTPEKEKEKDSEDEAWQQSRCDRPIVQFAGEASSEHYYSTVHGAVEAGWREARRLAQFYGISVSRSGTKSLL
ncbi:spermine oxidase [Drosophila santomea]|uniref:spermine oxidase n=1 Tax=Drosophila santomea TaxID=129105 RepID=UPI001CC9193B|nr:spermine oxidase [Drosophila santomea]